MGYQTYYTLTVENESPEIWEAIAAHEYAAFALGDDGESGESCKWYGHEDDMTKLSLQFPAAVFHLRGEGEEPGDIWEKDFKNGQKQVWRAQITMPKYDSAWQVAPPHANAVRAVPGWQRGGCAMICPVCQHSTDEHGLYGCNEGADAEFAALRAKAAAFDALSERIASGSWRVDQWEPAPFINGVGITITGTGERVRAATLAEAVRLAMDAEGER